MRTKSRRISLSAGNTGESSRAPRLLRHPLVQKALPWLAGAGMGLGHAAVASNCTVPQQGRCSSCGSCVVVVGSLVFWALSRKRGQGEFYEEKSR